MFICGSFKTSTIKGSKKWTWDKGLSKKMLRSRCSCDDFCSENTKAIFYNKHSEHWGHVRSKTDCRSDCVSAGWESLPPRCSFRIKQLWIVYLFIALCYSCFLWETWGSPTMISLHGPLLYTIYLIKSQVWKGILSLFAREPKRWVLVVAVWISVSFLLKCF